MATSGTITAKGGFEGRTVKLTWKATEQNIPNNYTDISWEFRGTGGDSAYYYYAGAFKVVIAGSTVYNSSAQIQLFNNTLISKGTKRIYHDSDGSGSFSVNIQAAIYQNGVNARGSGTATLNKIPRAATINTAPNFTDEENPTITYTNPAGSSAEELQTCISLGNGTIDVPYRDVSKTGGKYTYNLTESERNVLRKATINGNTRQVYFYLKTVSLGKTFYTKTARTLTIVNNKPTFTASAVDTNPITINLVGANDTVVKNHSIVEAKIATSTKKFATLKSVSVKNGSIQGQVIGPLSNETVTFNNSDSNIVNFSVKDSRGNTASKQVQLNFINYVPLTINLKASMSVEGTIRCSVKGNYFNNTFGKIANKLTLEYQYTDEDGTVSEWMPFSPTFSNDSYTASAEVTGLNYRKVYKIKARATDELETITSSDKEVNAYPVFDWGKSDFNFNVPVSAPVYMDSQGRPFADYIIEQGTTGIWTWRKYASGVGECWCYARFTTGGTTNKWGQLYVAAVNFTDDVSYPLDFAKEPVCTVSPKSNGANFWVCTKSENGEGDRTVPPSYQIVRGTTANQFSSGLFLTAKGVLA